MGLLDKILGKKPSTELVRTDQPTSNPNTVILKGEKHFDIYEDGNGDFRAQHNSGMWLFDTNHLFNYYEDATKFNSLESCQERCMRYVKGQMKTNVGTIEFIPYSK